MAAISFALFLLAVSNCYASYVRFSSPIVGANLNQPVSLKCQSDETIDIYFNNAKIVQTAGYTLTPRATIDLTLTIASVKLKDIGKYSCRSSASSLTGETVLQLRPFFTDNNKVFNKELSTKATVEFTILASPRPDIKYSRKKADGTYEVIAEITDFGRMIIGLPKYTISTENGHLNISNVEAVDGGDYKVETTFSGNIDNALFKLNVGAKPVITAPPPSSYDLISGEAAEIQCVFAKAPATIKWEIVQKDGKKIEVTGPKDVFSLDQTNLTISSVSPAHEGAKLTCTGSNVFGSASASTEIKMVYVKPAISQMSNADIAEGSSKSFRCIASGNPKPKVSWMRVNSTSQLSQKEASGESVFSIASAKVSDAGTYKCVAVISAMPKLKDEQSIVVNVLTKPVIIEGESTKSVVFAVGKGEKKELKCVASGNPVPTISVTKGNETVSGSESILDGKRTFVAEYSANKSSDGGALACVAKNSVGDVSLSIMITMIEKPSAPTGLMASDIDVKSVHLKWNKVDGATKYHVRQDTRDVISVSMTEHKVKGLNGGTKYKFSVAAENAAGVGPYSTVQEVTTEKYEKPSSPVNVQLPTPKQSKISWGKPASGSGDPALEYVLEVCTVKDGKCKYLNTNRTSLDLNLKENVEYSVKITAKNSRGSSSSQTFKFVVDGGPTTSPKPKLTDEPKPEAKAKSGLSGGAIAGIIIAVILILLIVIDLFCCFFNDCGFSHCCYQTCCADKSKEGYSTTETKDVEKAELKEVGNDHDETKTVPEEKDATKEKKTEDV